MLLGQADDLGGGVYKKRLGKNLYRSIVLAKGGRYWVYTFLFAKQDRANIAEDELRTFRAYAELFAQKTELQVARELAAADIEEICHDKETKVQE